MMKSSCAPNVTPLIDILLVLLIIFMVIRPNASHGLDAAIPRESDSKQPVSDSTVVVAVAADGGLTINQEPTTRDKLPGILKRHRAVFVQGAADAAYERVVEVIDLARGAGVTRVGLMPRNPR